MPDHRVSDVLPCVALGGLKVSRLIVGGNPFSGNSHQCRERDREMVSYYTVERIKATLRACEEASVNTLIARADQFICRVLTEYWAEGGTIQWIAQTCPEWACVEASIGQAVAYGAQGVFLHGGMMDRLFRAGRLEEAREWVSAAKGYGLSAGTAAHLPETNRAVLDAGLPVDFLCQSLFNLTDHGEAYLPQDRAAALEAVQGFGLPCVVYKALGAGRLEPRGALQVAYRGIRSFDALCVGFFTKHRPDEVAETVSLALQAMAGN